MSFREVSSDIETYNMKPMSAGTAIALYAKLLKEKEIAATKDSEMAMEEDVTMDAEVWKDFPLELHQHILQYCSVPELCRLRVVCRAWNDLIHHAFGAQLHNRYICISSTDAVDIVYNYNTRSNRDAVNTNLRNRNAVNIKSLRNSSWELIDLSTKKFYWINKELIYDGLRNDRFAYIAFHLTVAADKGLLCVLWSSMGREVMQIVNPVTRSVIEVPLFQRDRSVYVNARGAMTVAEDYSSFTLYFIFDTIIGRADRMLSLAQFDSQVGKWRELFSQPARMSPSHLVKLNESLYTLLCNNFETQLFAFSMVSETWTDTRITLPSDPELVTALGRLFIVLLDGGTDADFSYTACSPIRTRF